MGGLVTLVCLVGFVVLVLRRNAQVKGKPFFSWGSDTKKRSPIVKAITKNQPARNMKTAYWRAAKQGYAPRNRHAPTQPKNQSGKRDQVPQQLWAELNALTHDPATSERLVRNIKERNPCMPLKWCTERAIWEIERDRR